ncbi:MAG TPA: hypothetical protein PKC30_04020 [Saprospiraceae bacterium]|nr:hypothetical protein [Saprospiraceae bacterium]
MKVSDSGQSRAQISRSSIQRLYIAMRHLFIRGSYKPLGISGETMINSLLALKPEIYGSIADDEKVELNGLLYIFQRLPQGIEQCRYIKLISREGFDKTHFTPLIPSKRRRNCYRIDDEQMFIEMTRGRSDIYDVLTHLTFMYIEAEKIRKNALDSKDRKNRAWKMIEKIIEKIERGEEFSKEVGFTYLSTLLGRTYAETKEACDRFESAEKVNSLFSITYWMGKLSMDEFIDQLDREISFSSALRENLGHHIYGEEWATAIKQVLHNNQWTDRPVHIISSNMHSVMNCFYAKVALGSKVKAHSLEEYAEILSQSDNGHLRELVRKYALQNGMMELHDFTGTNISVQIFDCNAVPVKSLPQDLQWRQSSKGKNPVLIVMDYAFGEQAYETMDELLKPFETENLSVPFHVRSINIMGKAGILTGSKGDIMIPTAHVFEGSADNYPFENALLPSQFEGRGLGVYSGPMITVLGTSLQNKDILQYFMESSWQAIGLEMEGAHYQKAIQAASKIRNSIDPDVVLRYAYYASDNPLETGSTLASGSLGLDGVKPTYMITIAILNGIGESIL